MTELVFAIFYSSDYYFYKNRPMPSDYSFAMQLKKERLRVFRNAERCSNIFQ